MSNKELAIKLLDDLNEEELQQIILQLAKLNEEKKAKTDKERKQKAFDEIMRMAKTAPPDFDPEKERENALGEKYGV